MKEYSLVILEELSLANKIQDFNYDLLQERREKMHTFINSIIIVKGSKSSKLYK